MPELPEVEVTRRQLEPLIVGRTIVQVATTAPSYFFLTPPLRLAAALRGRRVVSLERRGKYLIAALDDRRRLLLHLGMTGQLFAAGVSSPRLLRRTGSGTAAPELQRSGFEPDAHTHLRLEFRDGGPALYFRDTRKFGKVQLLAPGEACPRLDRLGVDALCASGADLFAKTRTRKVAIKTVLLDQSVLAGVGNIYADEGLYLAGIRPTRSAHRLSRAACEALLGALQRVLLRSIETGGSSISDYVRPDGRDGGYQDERHVYGRQAEPCKRCATPIERRVLGQRSTFFCATCQR